MEAVDKAILELQEVYEFIKEIFEDTLICYGFSDIEFKVFITISEDTNFLEKINKITEFIKKHKLGIALDSIELAPVAVIENCGIKIYISITFGFV